MTIDWDHLARVLGFNDWDETERGAARYIPGAVPPPPLKLSHEEEALLARYQVEKAKERHETRSAAGSGRKTACLSTAAFNEGSR